MTSASHQKPWKQEVEQGFLRKELSTLNPTPSEIIL